MGSLITDMGVDDGSLFNRLRNKCDSLGREGEAAELPWREDVEDEEAHHRLGQRPFLERFLSIVEVLEGSAGA